jgi:CSLREA domain-containing protein
VRPFLRSVLLAAGMALSIVPAAPPTPALAMTFTVDSTADEPDAVPGDSICKSTITSRCTLRAAIMEANALPGRDTIGLPSGTFRLTVSGVDDNAAAGDLDITRDEVTINGAGPTQTIIDASRLGTPDRVFDVRPEATAILNGLRITGGHPMRSNDGLDGGGIRVFGSAAARLTNVSVFRNQSDSAGGGIVVRANGSLSLLDSTVDTNWATLEGGGISVVDGTLTLIESTVSRNTSNKSGGGILYAGSQFRAENSTISANTAHNTGGGMYLNFPPGTGSNRASHHGVFLTVANNATSTPGTGGNIYIGVGPLPGPLRFDLRNSIVAGATQGGNCAGQPITSGGNNLEDQNVCGFTAAGDLRNTNPLLLPLTLGANGTEVHPLSPMPNLSPAVDAFNCTGVDQRGASRPQEGDGKPGARCDIGAFEHIP